MLPKTYQTKPTYDIVKTEVSERISLATADSGCYAIGFVDNFSLFLAVLWHFEILDKFKAFCANLIKPGHLDSDKTVENSIEFNRLRRNHEKRVDNSDLYTLQKNEKNERPWETFPTTAHCFLNNSISDEQYTTLYTEFYARRKLLQAFLAKTPLELIYIENQVFLFWNILAVLQLRILKYKIVNNYDSLKPQ